jgi:L-aspartate oxidase
MKHVVVVGSGIAGLIAALETSRKHRVTLVTKAQLAESNTRYAQGGIAAALFRDDSVEEHVADTLRAGAGLCDPQAVEVLCSEGPQRVMDLIELGVVFDQRNGEFQRALEAAHSRARVLHAGGDATGLAIEMALVRAVRAADISVLEHTFACDLVMRNERVAGLEVLEESGTRRVLAADAIILASGGAGQIYRHTTNPSVATGDGVALAMRAGAEVANLEFYQFHPTALALPGNFLISEAVRGDGAVLRDADGNRFMQAVHPGAELAPRDVVARGIAGQMAKQGGRPVMLDATALGSAFLAERFPTIDAACRRSGLDWAKVPIPVTPAAHYWMGGVQTDSWGRTSVAGLFAAGEVACTGVHGANRLASNSLLESLVFAWRAAHLLTEETWPVDRGWPVWDVVTGAVQPVEVEDRSAPAEVVDRASLQQLMWDAAGIRRDGVDLRVAATRLARWRGDGSTVAALETGNLLTIAQVVVASALAREESRGAHFRVDFPETSVAFQQASIFAPKVPVSC